MLFPLLPPSGLDLSVLVAVLGGTLVLLYLTEVFGWSFGGLVVPGYLASVLVLSPPAGITVLIEAALTAIAVVVVSDLLSLTGVWSRFFGRERFLLLVLLSILVRQSCEVWLLPSMLTWLGGWAGGGLIEAQDAHSVGLVLVPLTANALGRDTIRRGLAQVLIPTAGAFFLLNTVLIPLTNVSLGSMALTYEDVSLDFLGSARAYFILGIGALVAARLNGAVAWSAGGILIPALLGLAWYEPLRILATLAEAVLLTLVYRGLVQLPVIRTLNLEGARKLAILFAMSALFRIGVAWVHELGMPVRTNELSGLGYLLSALIAAKIIQYRSMVSVVVPAVATSFIAFVGGNGAAWAIEQLAPGATISTEPLVQVPSARLLATPEGVVQLGRVRARIDASRAVALRLPAADLATWRGFWRDAEAWLNGQIPTLEPPPGLLLEQVAGEVGARAWWSLREEEERPDRVKGWGTALLRPGATGPALVLDRPWSDADAARDAVASCIAVDCAILFVAGAELPDGHDDARAALVATLQRPVASVSAMPPAERPPVSSVHYGDAVAAALSLDHPDWVASASEMAFLTELLAPALAGWSRGETTPTDVAALARLVGLRAEETRGCGEAPCLLLTPEQGGPLIVVRGGTAAPISIESPHPRRELGVWRLALSGFDWLNARYLVFNPAHDDLVIDVSQNPMHALHLGLRRALADEPGAMMLQLRGVGAAELARPPEDVVIGVGRPVFGQPPPALLPLLSEQRLAGVWSVRWAAERADEQGLSGGHLPSLQADLTFGGVAPAVLWFSEAARAALRVEDQPTLREWVGAAGLTLQECPQIETVLGLRGGSAEAVDLARRAAQQHNLNLLRRLVETRLPVRACWEPARQLGFIEIATRDVVERVWLLPVARAVVDVPAGAPLRTAAGWLPADLRIQRAP